MSERITRPGAAPPQRQKAPRHEVLSGRTAGLGAAAPRIGPTRGGVPA